MPDIATEKIEALSLKDLRALIMEGGMKTDGCIDKSDLRARAKESFDRLKMPGAKLGPVSKPIVAAVVAEELGIFDTEEEAANKKLEKEMAEKAAAEKKAKEDREAAERAVQERDAELELRKVEQAAIDAKLKAEADAIEKEKREKEKLAEAVRAEERAKERERRRAATKLKEEAKAQSAAHAAQLLPLVRANDAEKLLELLKTLPADCCDENSVTPLHAAASKGLTEIAVYLLDAGAKPNAVDEEGQTPLHSAAMFNRIECAKLLLGKGADARIADSNSQTARALAKLNQRHEIAELCLEAERTHEAREAAAAKVKADEAAAAQALQDAIDQCNALVGQQVYVEGLKARPEANGKTGYVVSAGDNGRCTVAIKIAGEEVEQLALKPVNLMPK